MSAHHDSDVVHHDEGVVWIWIEVSHLSPEEGETVVCGPGSALTHGIDALSNPLQHFHLRFCVGCDADGKENGSLSSEREDVVRTIK